MDIDDEYDFEMPRSDVLPPLREAFSENGLFPTIKEIFQFRLIIDANIVIRSILWSVTRRKNPEARSELVELLSCETIKGFAPTYLQVEIERKLPQLAHQKSIRLEKLREGWNEIEPKLRFVDVGEPDEASPVRDPKDTPYIKLQNELGYKILTKDKDIEAMGGDVMPVNVLLSMRRYSRAAAVEYSIKGAGGTALIVSSVVVEGIAKDVLPFIGKRLPGKGRTWLIGSLILVVLLLLHTPSRNWIFAKSRNLIDTLSPIISGVFSGLLKVAEIHNSAKAEAVEAADGFRDHC